MERKERERRRNDAGTAPTETETRKCELRRLLFDQFQNSYHSIAKTPRLEEIAGGPDETHDEVRNIISQTSEGPPILSNSVTEPGRDEEQWTDFPRVRTIPEQYSVTSQLALCPSDLSLYAPMETIESRSDTRGPSSSPPARRATDTLVTTPFTQPGRGLPYELWTYVIRFLELEPYALLHFCLTCKTFRERAEDILAALRKPMIYLDDVTEFNHFVDEVRTIPGRAQSIRELTLTPRAGQPPLAFSIVPHRLGRQLTNLHHLSLNSSDEAFNAHPSTWFLYGRTFCHVGDLTLCEVSFPSFSDFTCFITHFRALKRLSLVSISCAHSRVPPGTLRSPRILNRLEYLMLRQMNDGGHFLGLFIPQFFSRATLVRELLLDSTVFLHPLGALLLQGIRKHLRVLLLSFDIQLPMEESWKSWQRFVSAWHSEVTSIHLLIAVAQMLSHMVSLILNSYACMKCEPAKSRTLRP